MTTINLLSSTTSGFLEADFNQIKTLVNGQDDAAITTLNTHTQNTSTAHNLNTWVGTSSITTVGTVSSGTLQIKTNLSQSNSDNTYTGIYTNLTAGESLVFGNLVYMKGADGRVWKANATTSATMPAIGMAVASITTGSSGAIQVFGTAGDTAWSWTPGSVLYPSASTAGALTATAPSTAGNNVQSVAVALTATRILFNPNYVLVEV
jgi:hypothetical protein